MAVVGSLRIYAFTAIIMEIFFAVIYAFQQGVTDFHVRWLWRADPNCFFEYSPVSGY